MAAKHSLANCYRLGKGVEKDEIKAFEYYENLAKLEFADAQHQLGNCFYNGIGTRVDVVQAECWYKKAVNNGNVISKNALAKRYNKKEIKFQKFLNFKELSQLGLNYFRNKLIKNNEKGFDCKITLINLNNYKKGNNIRKDGKKVEFYEKLVKQGH